MTLDGVGKSEQVSDLSYPAALSLRWPWQLARVAAVRARRLSTLGQPNTGRARVLGWFSMPALWGMQMVMVGRTADRVYRWRSASVTLEDTSRKRVRPLLWLTGVIGGIAVQMAILLLPILVITALLAVGVQVPPAALAMLETTMILYFLSIVAVEVARERRRQREPESPLSLLGQRRDQLAEDGPAWLLTSLACGRKGDAHQLVDLLTPIWRTERAVVVLYPAEEGLVPVYLRWGGQLDRGAVRRIVLDYRSDPAAG